MTWWLRFGVRGSGHRVLVRKMRADTIAVVWGRQCRTGGTPAAGVAAGGHRGGPGGRTAAHGHRRTRVRIRPVEGLPLLHVEEPTLSGMGWLIKNVLDRVVALIGLVLLLPFFPIVAIAIKVSDPGPVFFRQPRVGREGTRFRVWKLRTMYTDAEERLASLVDQNESDGLLFKIKNDPRIFKVGKFLRSTSIDELPQLINVLVGDMSLVGPRPLPADDGEFLGDVPSTPAGPARNHRTVAGLRPVRSLLGTTRCGSTSTTSTTGPCCWTW